MKQSSRSQLETIRIDLPDRSFAFDNVGNRIRIQRYDFRFLPSRFLGALHARFIARTWEISGLAACRASLIKVYGRIVECKRLPAGGNFICSTRGYSRNNRAFCNGLRITVVRYSFYSPSLSTIFRKARKAKRLFDAKFAPDLRSN